MNPCRNTRVGFSTTVLDRSISLDKLYELQTEVVEICGYSPEAWGKLRIDLSHADIPVGLHCPIPFAGWVKQFDITGQGEHRRAAFELVEMTLQAARLVNGAYVNVHFPSVVRRPADLCGLRQSGYLNSVMNSARELHALSEKYKVPVLLENVGPNPFFYKAEHFRAMFERVPGLRLCFDPGHLHVLPNGEDVYSFAEDLIAFIISVHI